MNNKFDAIVIGTGISGGWAAKELCEGGLKTLVLERGRMVTHIKDYPTMHMDPWDFKHRDKRTPEALARQHKQKANGQVKKESAAHWFVDDIEHPYNEKKPFNWIRGYHVGGRSIMWGRQTYRMGDIDFEANKKDGIGVDWPIRYKDVEKWYDKVEKYIGVSGENRGLPQLPDGKLSPAMPFNVVEKEFQKQIESKYDDRIVMPSRVAHITGSKEHEGRSKCQFRNRCVRGCPFGGYFSSNSSTLPAAERTGNMMLRPNSIVHEIVYNENTGKASGVRVIDAETHEKFYFEADIIFCNASTVATASILLQSKSKRFPNGLGNDSGQLGRNLMDHHMKAGAVATVKGFEDRYYKGRKPTSFYVPRFRNLSDETNQKSFIRGYGFQGGVGRAENWTQNIPEFSFGKNLKEKLLQPGGWRIGMYGFGECLPYQNNRITLNYEKLDKWGLPTVEFDVKFGENEKKMRKDMVQQAVEMLTNAGFDNVKPIKGKSNPGVAIHEMGTARMGKDPKTSVLNENNQIHTVPNVYVTDGACMTSSACQNPSLTYMALTARAAHHAINTFKKNRKA